MPCALPPVDQSVSQLGWADGLFLPDPDLARTTSTRVVPVNHPGWDFLADEGSPVVAAFEGTVVHVGWQPYGTSSRPGTDALGHYVVIEHRGADAWGRTLWTRYSHMRSSSGLRVGQAVRTGDLVGYVGTSGQRPGARRARLYFQVVRAGEAGDFERGHGVDIAAFFAERGVQRVGTQTPGPEQTPFAQTPGWGGQLQQVGECAGGGLGTARPGPGSGVQDPRYSRFGRTQLSRNDPYAPAFYAEDAVDSSFGALAGYWLAWAVGAGAALFALHRYAMPRMGLRGLGACPCDTNPNGRACRELAAQALRREKRR